MQDKSNRRLLDIDIPAQPEVLVKLSLLLAEDEVDLQAASLLISSDMALAAAVLKAVNSSMYGLRGRVQSVQQAITYLGTREVAAVTFEMGLRAVFPRRARARAAVGARARARPADGPDRPGARRRPVGRALGGPVRGMRQGGACSATPPTLQRRCCAQAKNDEELLMLEHAEFGVSHDTLGAALCESWGVAPQAVDSVRYHVIVNSTLELPMQLQRRAICAISALAHALMTDPDTLDEVARKVAPQAELDPTAGAARRAPGAGADRDGGRAREDRRLDPPGLAQRAPTSRPSRPTPSPPAPTSSSRRR